ncbi:hypothetical protein SDC9_22713 [bioreactor metagenome]|uniref:Uncharacterized protein n=1 Tax=bioreactor metagenome TaxID=1076179 RepID=A0A644UDD3_9ZZZZ
MAVSFNFIEIKDTLREKNKLKSWIKSIVEQKRMKVGGGYIQYFCL